MESRDGTFMATLILIHRMDRYQAATLAMFLVGMALIIIGQVGERLGWWNDFGEWSTALGLVLGAASVAIAILLGATKSEVRVVGDAVRFVGGEVHFVRDEVRLVGNEVHLVRDEVRQANTKLGQANTKLDQSNGTLQSIVVLLTQIRDRLP